MITDFEIDFEIITEKKNEEKIKVIIGEAIRGLFESVSFDVKEFKEDIFYEVDDKKPIRSGTELDVKIDTIQGKEATAHKQGFLLSIKGLEKIPDVKECDEVKIRITKVMRRFGFAELVGQGRIKKKKIDFSKHSNPIKICCNFGRRLVHLENIDDPTNFYLMIVLKLTEVLKKSKLKYVVQHSCSSRYQNVTIFDDIRSLKKSIVSFVSRIIEFF